MTFLDPAALLGFAVLPVFPLFVVKVFRPHDYALWIRGNKIWCFLGAIFFAVVYLTTQWFRIEWAGNALDELALFGNFMALVVQVIVGLVAGLYWLLHEFLLD